MRDADHEMPSVLNDIIGVSGGAQEQRCKPQKTYHRSIPSPVISEFAQRSSQM